MKVYTKTGDKGTTGLLTGQRVDKDSLRVEAYGSIDEINSALGLARATVKNSEVRDTIFSLQKMLMMLMAEVASVDAVDHYISEEHVTKLEQLMDAYDEKLTPLKNFIIPGDTLGSATLDNARTTVRRAERNILRLSRSENVDKPVLLLLNRLSDLCFVLSRVETEV